MARVKPYSAPAGLDGADAAPHPLSHAPHGQTYQHAEIGPRGEACPGAEGKPAATQGDFASAARQAGIQKRRRRLRGLCAGFRRTLDTVLGLASAILRQSAAVSKDLDWTASPSSAARG